MSASLKITLLSFLALILSLSGSFAQQVTIVSPANGTTITPGQSLNVSLKVQSTTSSVNFISFSTAFENTKFTPSGSLGRPYVGSVFPQQQGGGVTFDGSQFTYNFNITVPQAEDFIDGFPGTYRFTVANYYLLGALYSPVTQLTSADVKVDNGPSQGGN